MSSNRGLGRGFDALIPTQLVEEEFDITAKADAGKTGDQIVEVKPTEVDPNPHQPRQDFDIAELNGLAESIRIHGILQPLVVTRVGERYELIAGERRLRAAKLAGLKTVPVIVRTFDEQQKLELALIENLQRSDLNPIETATAYRKLVDQFNLLVEEVARRVGRSRPAVSNTMRLLNLPIDAKRAVAAGDLSEGLARVILTLDEPQKQAQMLKVIQQRNMNTRQAEEYARGLRGESGSKEKAEARVQYQNDFTRGLGEILSTKVRQVPTAKGGNLVIEYKSEEDLERIARQIRGL